MRAKDFRSLSPQAQEELRKEAVNAVLEGRTRKEVGEVFGISGKSVGLWVKKHEEAGAKALNAKRRGRPRGGILKPWQSAQIVRTIIDGRPDQLGLPYYLWNREAVSSLIEKRFDISLSVWTAGRYLVRWGFTPQKPVERVFLKNPVEVKLWLNEDYPAIRRRAKNYNAEIYWGDEKGCCIDHSLVRSTNKGEGIPFSRDTDRRPHFQMISAITNRGRVKFMFYKGRYRFSVFHDFSTRIIREAGRKVFLVIDGRPVHNSRKVKTWLKKNGSRIRLFLLPGYNRELIKPHDVLGREPQEVLT